MPISPISQSSASSRTSSRAGVVDGDGDSQQSGSLEAEFTRLMEEIAGRAKKLAHRAQELAIEIPPLAAIVKHAEPVQKPAKEDVEVDDETDQQNRDVAADISQDGPESFEEARLSANPEQSEDASEAAAPVVFAEGRTAAAVASSEPGEVSKEVVSGAFEESVPVEHQAGPVNHESSQVVADAEGEVAAPPPAAAEVTSDGTAVISKETKGASKARHDQPAEVQKAAVPENPVREQVARNQVSPKQLTDVSDDFETRTAKGQSEVAPGAAVAAAPVPRAPAATPAVETLTATLLRHASEALGRVMGRERGDTVSGIRSVSAMQPPSSFNLSVEQKASREAPRLNTPRPLTQQAGLRMMEKVEQVLKEAVKAKDGKSVSLKLDPPNLGQMRVDVSLRDGTLHARLTPESPAVAAFLQERAHDLQGMLRKLGLSVDEVTVSVRNEEFTSNENHSEGASSGRKDRSSDEPAGKNFPSGNVVSTAPEHRMSNPVDHWVA